MTVGVAREGAPASGRTRLVGRVAELQQLVEFMDTVAAGDSGGLLLHGEAGSGKSFLIARLLDELPPRRWHVLATEADALERQIPYAAMARLARRFADEVGDASARELAASLDLLGGEDPEALAASFGRVCSHATTLIANLLERRPVALVIDDVDTLDDDSLAVLSIVVRRLAVGRLAFLGTSRSDPRHAHQALATLVGRLASEMTDQRTIELTPLAEDDLRELLHDVIGVPPDAVLLDAVHTRAGGNPFFAREIAQTLLQAGQLSIDEGQAHLAAPSTELRLTGTDALRRRLERLPRSTRDVLEAVAVLGMASLAHLALLAAVVDRPEHAVATAFDELVRSQVFVETDDGHAFAHDLVRDAVYDALGPARRRALHGAIAGHLTRDRAAGRPIDLMVLARHVSIIAEPGDEHAAAILADSADLARHLAPEFAAAMYQRALTVAGPPMEPTLLARRSRALSLAGRPTEAAEVGMAALEVLPAGPERDRTITSVIGALMESGRAERALAVAEEAVRAGARPPIQAHRANLLWVTQRWDEALSGGRDVLAAPTASPGERLLVLAPLLLMAAYSDRPAPLIDLTDEMQAIGADQPPTLALYAEAMAGFALATSGQVARALAPLERAELLVDEVGGTAFRGNILVARVFVDWLQGRWDEAADGIAAALTELEHADYALFSGLLHAIEIEIRTCRGLPVDLPAAPRVHAPHIGDLHAWAVAGARLATGDPVAARRELATAMRDRTEQIAYRSPALSRMVEIEVANGDQRAAETVMATLEADGQSHTNPWGRVLLQHARAVARQDVDAARAAVAEAEAGTFAWERARALATVVELDPSADREATDAYVALQALGADPLRRRVGGLMRERGVPVPRRRRARAGPLTESEMRIARLVQQGMRNREIASVLHYSPRTVEVYLSRIYRKLGIASRLELARVLDSEALAGDGW